MHNILTLRSRSSIPGYSYIGIVRWGGHHGLYSTDHHRKIVKHSYMRNIQAYNDTGYRWRVYNGGSCENYALRRPYGSKGSRAETMAIIAYRAAQIYMGTGVFVCTKVNKSLVN